jgi:hypothetical protein
MGFWDYKEATMTKHDPTYLLKAANPYKADDPISQQPELAKDAMFEEITMNETPATTKIRNKNTRGKFLLATGAAALALVAGLSVMNLKATKPIEAPPATQPNDDNNDNNNSNKALEFVSDGASLKADEIVIDVNGKKFSPGNAGRTLQVGGDPGNSEYSTLELSWKEHGVDMRLYFYTKSDGKDYWIAEIRTYDGLEIPLSPANSGPDRLDDQLSVDGTSAGEYFKAPLGQSFKGDFTGNLKYEPNGKTIGTLTIKGLEIPFKRPGSDRGVSTTFELEPKATSNRATTADLSAALADTENP